MLRNDVADELSTVPRPVLSDQDVSAAVWAALADPSVAVGDYRLLAIAPNAGDLHGKPLIGVTGVAPAASAPRMQRLAPRLHPVI